MEKNQNFNEIACYQCGAKLEYAPGTMSLVCPYCGAENKIEIDKSKLADALREIDYYEFLKNEETISDDNSIETTVIECQACGATTEINENTVSLECPYCGTPLVKDKQEVKKSIKPSALIPFAITQKDASKKFQEWIKKGWFTPKKAKLYATHNKIQGIYVPYWTFDANTVTQYTGERGIDYEDTDTDDEGNTTTTTRTEWTRVSGTVYNSFDDVLAVASNSLAKDYQLPLSGWNLSELVPYDTKFLAGFNAEAYSISVKDGFENAKFQMDIEIDRTIKNDIGGDHQRILDKHTEYNDITFKHILLPIWISSYRYKDKIYRFIVNGQTGDVIGKKPKAVGKIILIIIIIIAIIILFYYLS